MRNEATLLAMLLSVVISTPDKDLIGIHLACDIEAARWAIPGHNHGASGTTKNHQMSGDKINVNLPEMP